MEPNDFLNKYLFQGPKKEELKQELAYEESKAKRRSLGNIR